MSVYLDVSVLVALFTADAFNARADRALATVNDSLVVSEFTVTEFSSVISTRVRTRDLKIEEARDAFAKFDTWVGLHTQRIDVISVDVAGATTLVRRLELSLRAPDALHLAIVQRSAARLLTFDKAMAAVARTIGVDVVPI